MTLYKKNILCILAIIIFVILGIFAFLPLREIYLTIAMTPEEIESSESARFWISKKDNIWLFSIGVLSNIINGIVVLKYMVSQNITNKKLKEIQVVQ